MVVAYIVGAGRKGTGVKYRTIVGMGSVELRVFSGGPSISVVDPPHLTEKPEGSCWGAFERHLRQITYHITQSTEKNVNLFLTHLPENLKYNLLGSTPVFFVLKSNKK